MTNLEEICEAALFQEVKHLSDGKTIVIDSKTEKLYYRKTLSYYSVPVYRFLREQSHKCIPGIKTFWQEEGKLIVIEEFIQGRTLDTVLDKENISFDEKKRILLEICDGLIFLHDAKPPIIHRDIKASNVMISDEGSVYIIDYDAAKQYIAGKEKDTVLIGTEGVAAPEQYGFGQSDERTDIFALGKLIQRMFPDSSAMLKIAEKATKLQPELRFNSVKAIKSRVEKCWNPEISVAEHEWEKTKETVKSRRFKMLLAFAAIIAVITGAICVYAYFIYPDIVLKKTNYENGISYMKAGRYVDADRAFAVCGDDYQDVAVLRKECSEMSYKSEYRDIAEAAVQKYWKDTNLINYKDALLACLDVKKKGIDNGETLDFFISDIKKKAVEYAEDGDFIAAEKLCTYMEITSVDLKEQADDMDNEVKHIKVETLKGEGNYIDAFDELMSVSEMGDNYYEAVSMLYGYGDLMMEKTEYGKAVEAFDVLKKTLADSEPIEEFMDSDQKSLEARYQYCSANLESPDLNSRVYANFLCTMNYPGAEELRAKVFELKLEVSCINVNQFGNFAVLINVCGGESGKYPKLTVDMLFDNGTHGTYEVTKYKYGDQLKIYRTYQNTLDPTDMPNKHNIKITVLDENGKVLGRYDGPIKDE